MSQYKILRKPTNGTAEDVELDQHLGQTSMMSQADHTGGLLISFNDKNSVDAVQ